MPTLVVAVWRMRWHGSIRCLRGLSCPGNRVGSRIVPAARRLAGAGATQPDDIREAEACYQQALTVAQAQQARLLHLRAAVSLGRLWQRQDRGDAAHELVAASLAHFDENVTCPDTVAARAFLAAAPNQDVPNE